MSVKLKLSTEKPPKIPQGSLANGEEFIFRWSDVEVDIESLSTISSESETGSEYDTEQRMRQKSFVEIWSKDEIWESLMVLPDAEEINETIKNDNKNDILDKNLNTTLLLCSWLGKAQMLAAVIETGKASIAAVDIKGRSAVHLASYAGAADCLKILLEHGAKVDQWEATNQLSPLHCAAGAGRLSCVKLLIKHGADVNIGLINRSPLYYAVQSSEVACVKELLDNKAIPNTPQIFSETPLHVAVNLRSIEMIKLLIEYGAAINVQCGSDKMTPLHLAAEDGDIECARILIDSGAQLSSRNHKKQTPLHLAALSQSSETIELLLYKGSDPNALDKDGRTPLHTAVAKVTRSCECVKLLLDARANVNQPDIFGYTPLHLAALNEFSHCVMLLINYGGDVTARTNGGISVLNFIIRKTPDVISKYIAKFDASIKLNDHELGDVDCELKLDFKVLVPTMGNKETELLLNFIEVGHKEILTHPLSETFLFLKWRRIRKFFLFSLVYHLFFVCLFTIYVIEVFLKNCPSAKTAERGCWVSNYALNTGYIIIVLNMILLSKELFQIAHSWLNYLKQWENWLQWSIIISVFLAVQPKSNMNIKQDVYTWQHHVAAYSIFLTWIELMMIVGRFPIFGLYIQMFTRVFVNFTKFMVAYFCLFIAFALSFGVIFANYPAFEDLKWVLLKVIIMMSGELEYEDVFFPDNEKEIGIRYPYTAHLMYFCFVILVTLILNNLLVGLAVSDIQGLQQSAGLDRLVRQAELVAHLESMLFSKFLTWIPHKLKKFFHNQALLLKSQYHSAMYIKPNDPREERLPKYLISNIYRLVVEKKERPKSKKNRKFKVDCCEITSPSLSRISSYNSEKRNQSLLKSQVDDLCRDFHEYNKIMKQKLEKISSQLMSNQT